MLSQLQHGPLSHRSLWGRSKQGCLRSHIGYHGCPQPPAQHSCRSGSPLRPCPRCGPDLPARSRGQSSLLQHQGSGQAGAAHEGVWRGQPRSPWHRPSWQSLASKMAPSSSPAVLRQESQELWKKLGIEPRGIDREIVECMHRTTYGRGQRLCEPDTAGPANCAWPTAGAAP